MQLIICTETDKKCKSDYIYIKSTIESFYNINQTNIKLTPVYMGGRGNYLKTEKTIETSIKQYRSTSKQNTSVVLCCFDCDNYTVVPEDKRFLNEVKQYCKRKDYKFVWFCRDIEEVYLGKRIERTLKKKEAESFKRKKEIVGIDIECLRHAKYKKRCSNLCYVLDKLL